MRTMLRWITQPKLIFSVVCFPVLALGSARSITAAQLKEAQITQIVKDVNLLPGQAASRTAIINDYVRDGTAVRTGEESRTELTFRDKTLARLGANTVFSFNEGTRQLDLGGGAMLLRVPKGAGGATVRTAAVTAAITGTTVLLEYHPKAYIKLISLEGTARMYLKGRWGESVLIKPGQMLIVNPKAKRLPDPVDVDLKRLLKTSDLINGFRPMGSEALIAEEIHHQDEQKAEGNLIDTNLVIYGRGTLVSLIDPTSLDTIDQKTNAVRNQKVGFQPIKFGPLPTILTPNPYVIGSGTSIQTDPMITTAGQTDFGKIYRSNADDGSPADYFFGAASPFDGTINFNSIAENPANLPIAAFKFISLQLSGNPTISLGTGGATSLILISEGGITSGAPGGTLTFPNMSLVLLAAQNGSINLGNTISFANMPLLQFYARGAGSNLTLASPMTGMGTLQLTAEGSVQINGSEGAQFFNSFSGVDFLAGAGVIKVSGGISITALNAVNFTMSQFSIGNTSVFLGSNNTGVVNIDASANQNLFSNASTVQIFALNAINITGGTTMTFGNLTNASFTAGTEIQAPTMTFSHPGGLLDMIANGGDINVQAILGGDLIEANNNLITNGDLSSRIASAGLSIKVGGNLTNSQETIVNSLLAPQITVGGTLTSPDVETVGNVSAAHVIILNLNTIFSLSNTINTVLTAGTGGITPYVIAGPNTLHTFFVSTIQSHAATTGINFSGNNYSLPGSNGGQLAINANSQVFSTATGISGANFNGGDSSDPALSAGGGGTLVINSATNLGLINTSISATSGMMGDPAGNPSTLGGNGGNVTLNSGDELDIQNSVVQVSSADPAGTIGRRSSATGGNITISNSNTSTSTAIKIDSTSQLLALLENTPTAVGGLIKIEATQTTGASHISITNGATGKIETDNGAIDVRHFSDSGVIDITNPSMSAQIIKIATLGDNSTLNIGGGAISAGTILKLYAGSISNSNNSTINFIVNCSLAGETISIAANTVNVNGGVVVTTNATQTTIYTNHSNYSGLGGSAPAGSGSFTGAGMTRTLLQAPALGAPGGP